MNKGPYERLKGLILNELQNIIVQNHFAWANYAQLTHNFLKIETTMRKKLNFPLCILCLTLSVSAFSQKNGTDNITAVKLTSVIGQQYFEKINISTFTVDKNYILRPTKGYKIVYFASEKKIAIQSKTIKSTSSKPAAPGFDIQKVPGGTMFCFCDQAQDDCKIEPRIDVNTLFFDCLGYCGCGSITIYDTSDPIIGYQTAGGGWFNF